MLSMSQLATAELVPSSGRMLNSRSYSPSRSDTTPVAELERTALDLDAQQTRHRPRPVVRSHVRRALTPTRPRSARPANGPYAGPPDSPNPAPQRCLHYHPSDSRIPELLHSKGASNDITSLDQRWGRVAACAPLSRPVSRRRRRETHRGASVGSRAGGGIRRSFL